MNPNATTPSSCVGATPAWPAPLAPAAFHGLAGEVVRTLEPGTEADPAALLLNTLVMVGNAAGRGPWYGVDFGRHGTNLFLALVGRSARARKGTSMNGPRRIMELADPDWAARCQGSGLESGQALVWAVRDGAVRADERGRQEADPGVDDKRLLVVEEEFSQVLRAGQRQGSNLSAVLRQAWDGGTLRTTAKARPAVATDPHVSVIAHTTEEELRRLLGHVDLFNGFANRFLWACVQRAKHLPRGGGVPEGAIAELGRRVGEALAFAKSAGRATMDAATQHLWDTAYLVLEADRLGPYGAVTARSSPLVLRLATIYALLDRSATIREAHLDAALAVWEYCDDSARCLFGESAGDPRAERVLRELEGRGPLSRTEVGLLFGNRLPAPELDALRDYLVGLDKIEVAKEQTRGRSKEVWELPA